MSTRLLSLVLTLAVSAPFTAPGQTLWNPQDPGTAMTEHVVNVDGSHRQIVWDEHAGFVMSVDAAATYDNWSTVDEAPRVRIGLDQASIDLRNRDFVITVQTSLRQGYGSAFQAGLCVVFGPRDLLVWGPHGGTDLRFRRPGGPDRWQTLTTTTAYLKIKRRGNSYSAWFSTDGVFWSHAWTETIHQTPSAVGTILKTWGTPHAETVDFQHFELTHVEGEPGWWSFNTPYNDSTAPALHFIYDLSGKDFLFKLFLRDSPADTGDPFDDKLYLIHGSGNTDGVYDAKKTFDRVTEYMDGTGETYNDVDAVIVAPRFLRGDHPYPGRPDFQYQELRGEEDWTLIDLHEDYIREEFAAPGPYNDDRFYILGHSGGGQFVVRFATAHAPKLIRAAASSPSSPTFPTQSYRWPFGTLITEDHDNGNPRLWADLPSLYDLQLGLVMGENDNLVGRGDEDDRYEAAVLAYSRHDAARKYLRQMRRASGGNSHVTVFFCPETAHGFGSHNKLDVALKFLFGDSTDRLEIRQWRYDGYALDHQDELEEISPADVPTELFEYFKFTKFDDPPGDSATRYIFLPGDRCRVVDEDGNFVRSVSYTLEHTDSTLSLNVEGVTYNRPYVTYGKLRLYRPNGYSFLQESPVATSTFVTEQVVDRPLYVYSGTERNLQGPVCGPFPEYPIQLNSDGTVTDPSTGFANPFPTMRAWYYDALKGLLYFTDASGTTKNKFRIGEWRWGTDADGGDFLAGWHTLDDAGDPRKEIQSGRIYNPRYFEEWDVAVLDYDGDGTTDIVDNCPVDANSDQDDSDGDGLGDSCDETPVAAPPYVAASDGTDSTAVRITWYAAPGATHYRLFRHTVDNPDSAVPLGGWYRELSLDDTSADPGVDFRYWVKSAISGSGAGASAFSISDTGWRALAAPPFIEASDGADVSQVTVTWGTVEGAAAHRVYHSQIPDHLSATPLSPWLEDTEYGDSSADPGVTYYYWVSAALDLSGAREGSLSTSNSGWRAPDCNVNLAPDLDDIAAGLSPDCNLNQVPDECDVVDGSRDCNRNRVPDECDIAPRVEFASHAGYLVGEGPFAVAAADLDGDGDVDLVSANFVADGIAVLPNTGSGVFATAVEFAVGEGPSGVAAGDLDGDRDVDLAVTLFEEASVVVLTNHGDGSFAHDASYAVGDAPSAVIATDLDPDGVPDLVISNSDSDTVTVLWGDGSGGFTQEVFQVGDEPVAVVAGDLDGDGDGDLAVAEWDGQAVSIFGNDGGKYGVRGTYPVLGKARDLAAADLDGDDDIDLVVAVNDADRLFMLANNGDGSFADRPAVDVGATPQSVAAADLDLDGDLDLVASIGSSDLIVLLNRGDGSFVELGLFPVGETPMGLATGLIDTDLLPDLAVANANSGTVSVVLNTTTEAESEDRNGDLWPDECEPRRVVGRRGP